MIGVIVGCLGVRWDIWRAAEMAGWGGARLYSVYHVERAHVEGVHVVLEPVAQLHRQAVLALIPHGAPQR